jgi:hypothetical protein
MPRLLLLLLPLERLIITKPSKMLSVQPNKQTIQHHHTQKKNKVMISHKIQASSGKPKTSAFQSTHLLMFWSPLATFSGNDL